MDESNDPNDKGFATGEDNFSGGFAIVGESYPDLPHYPNTINFTAHVPDSTSITVVNPYNSVCSGGGGIIAFPYQHVKVAIPLYDPWKIVRAVAETDSTYTIGVDFDDVPLERACPYCPAKMPYRLHDEPFPHDADCIVLKARAMLATMPHVEVKNEGI